MEENMNKDSIQKTDTNVVVVKAKPVRRVYKGNGRSQRFNKIPQTILDDPEINGAIETLPKNYNFEIHKTIWRVRDLKVKRVALQLPEGLLLYSMIISDIIERFTDADTVIMGDVTYGACCIDDYTAKALGADLLIHYGHSCLIPIDQTHEIKVLYIFVNIFFDTSHFIESVKLNFLPTKRLAFVSTIQFVATMHAAAKELRECGYDIHLAQSRPLSPGEILGCTSPRIPKDTILIYLGDGRFHIESVMIANPTLEAYKYDPYEKKFTEEQYDHLAMRTNRKKAIDRAKNVQTFGLILGTLGRQGSAKVMHYLQDRLACHNKMGWLVLLSEIFPAKLDLFKDIDAFVQVACPRLSIDWGTAFSKPLLTPYELSVVLGDAKWEISTSEVNENYAYPMDFYASKSLGFWTPNYKSEKECEGQNIGKNCCGKCKDNTSVVT
ncbi:2-(3-amino-3-carboxypropyl)histidine synthase subunit 1 [Contarinia nasturtii]|uniref:2-(3-amino-3-carboxypropyl)histidine synthase subunit 1 n=1 Tax=Contarinia nasturtii TaxID=265458 RepID=UPI0012D38C93|nr:2-(3-amino-3-carboxypropyl)histidine synthase subunit 1 [Contarinia nasturtii]